MKKEDIILTVLLILIILIFLPLATYVVMNLIDGMTIVKIIQIKQQPVIYQPTTKIIKETNIVNKTVYSYPENRSDCTLVRIIKNRIPTGEYFMHCEALN